MQLIPRTVVRALGATLLAALGSAAPAQTTPAQTPLARQGEDDVIHSFTFHDRQVLRMGDRTLIHRELTGVSTNAKGRGMFHNLGMRCLATIEIEGGRAVSSGRCVDVDVDGDQIFHTFENRGGTGAHVLIGGTGKYAGISGRQEFTIPGPTKAPDGVSVLIVPARASWKLP